MMINYNRILVFLLTTLITYPCDRAHARSWDLAVTIGQEINFLTLNGTTIRTKNPSAVSLTALAYNDETRDMFLGDLRNKNVSIFVKELDVENANWTALLNNTYSSHIIGMVYHPASSSLFYIDSKLSAIVKLHIVNKNENKTKRDFVDSNTPQVIIKLPQQSPRGIALDLCKKRLYWTNSNTSSPSIESSDLFGNDRKIIINTNLYEPLSVAVDHSTGKIYWIDDEEGIHYKIERSNLDGTNRELMFQGRHQQPVQIAVDNEAVYWTDWTYYAVWRLNKTKQEGSQPSIWKSFFDSNRDSEPYGIIARDNLGSVNCAAAAESLRSYVDTGDIRDEADGVLITSTEDVSEKIEQDGMFCLNGGKLINKNTTCICKSGYEGQHCESSVCQNFCVHGECRVDEMGKPRCTCSPMFRGRRCEQDVCLKYCLNDGECEIRNGEPYCKCSNDARGARCEDTTRVQEVCGILCSSSYEQFGEYDRQICRCSQKNMTESSLPYDFYNNGVMNKTVLITLSVVISVLMILTVVLSYFVNKYRRRPRIKKRFVVSKNGITPLTSRPQLPGDQCEIMIENCCNMNICETPCFEPKLRNSEPRISKKEEKKTLLQDMEGDNSC